VDRSAEQQRVVKQFDTAQQAAHYSSEFNTNRQKRSRRCILEAMAGLSPDSRILDLPCGTGRLLPLILDLGHRYSGADVSEHMVNAARQKLAELRGSTESEPHADFRVEDIMQLSYPDDAFDAVIVNRLFHHYTQAQTRRSALRELNRVCSGPIIVFFLNTWTVRGLQFHLKYIREEEQGRLPISVRTFRSDGESAGLEMTRTHATRGRFNKEWYATFQRKTG